jgi:hypothetical protein
MSNAIATIPNYCSYETFKTGFSEGIGVYSETTTAPENAKYPNRIRVLYWGKEWKVKATFLVDANNNTKCVPKNLKLANSCDWFDAYSVQYDDKGKDHISSSGEDVVEDHYQDIEDELNERIISVVSNSDDSGLSSSRNSTAKSWRRRIERETESFRYSAEKGCIEWLETGSIGLKKTNSDQDLIRSFEEQFKRRKFGVKLSDKIKSENLSVNESGMFPVCQTHLHRKFGTDNSLCEDVQTFNAGESTLEEEVFEEDLYYLGPPKVC